MKEALVFRSTCGIPSINTPLFTEMTCVCVIIMGQNVSRKEDVSYSYILSG